VALENHAYFLFGAKDQFNPADEAGYWNTAFLIGPDGALIGKHVKNHTVHFFRDGVPGTQARAIPTSLGRLGVAVCFDMDYPDVARRLTEDGAEVFLVPNDDPPEWGPVQRVQHRLMFQMRAAECGRWLARADVAGGTSAAAPTGQEIARVSTTQAVSLDVTIGRETGKTLFIRGGWRFGQGCFAALLALWAAGLSRWLNGNRLRGLKQHSPRPE
jgi:apolipoprotein N-acyltransferase